MESILSADILRTIKALSRRHRISERDMAEALMCFSASALCSDDVHDGCARFRELAGRLCIEVHSRHPEIPQTFAHLVQTQ